MFYSRLFWTAIILVQISLLLFVMVNQFTYMNERPLLTKVITQYVDRLAFPAVTICGDRFSERNHSLSAFQEEVLENLSAFNETYFTSMPPEQYQEINLASIYKSLQFSGEEMVETCFFGRINCIKLVQKSWGKQTLCYNINSLLKSGVSHGNETTSQRLISTAPGAELGLVIGLKLSSDSGVKVRFLP